MKKSIYCVGQKVLVGIHREAATVWSITYPGTVNVFFDDMKAPFMEQVKESEIQPVEEYLDETNYFYHHSRFGIFQSRANDAFADYMLTLEDFEQGIAQSDAARAFLLCRLDGYAKAIQLNLALQRMAGINMGQWGSLTLNHHFPLVNPENVAGYKDA